MSIAPQVLTCSQVAQLLNMKLPTFYPRQRSLIEVHGFPPPVPGLGRRWDPQAIAAWIARQSGTTAAPTPAANEDDDWAAKLDGRAAAFSGRP